MFRLVPEMSLRWDGSCQLKLRHHSCAFALALVLSWYFLFVLIFSSICLVANWYWPLINSKGCFPSKPECQVKYNLPQLPNYLRVSNVGHKDRFLSSSLRKSQVNFQHGDLVEHQYIFLKKVFILLVFCDYALISSYSFPETVLAVRGRIITPRRCPCPNIWNLWLCYVTGQGELGSQMELKLLISGL